MTKLQSVCRIIAPLMPLNALRTFLFRVGGVKVGKRVMISKGTKIMEGVTIEDSVSIRGNVLVGSGSIMRKGSVVEENCILYCCEIGEGTIIHRGSTISGCDTYTLRIGKECSVGSYTYLDGSGMLKIGDHVQIASSGTGIFSHSSVKNCLVGNKRNSQEYRQGQIIDQVQIGDHVWIGGNVTIYPGVKIDHHSIVLPNSAVNRIVESYTMVGGVPATPQKGIDISDKDITFTAVDK